MRKPAAAAAGLTHAAAFYHTPDDYLDSVLTFVRAGIGRGDPVFVAVPGPKAGLLRECLNGESAAVLFADMGEMGRNPAWIIPRVQAFLDQHPGRPVHYVGEPIWQTRTAEELTEATRHEALINLAFGGVPASILCPYDAASLPARLLAQAEQTHPVLIRAGIAAPSARYAGPAPFPDGCDEPLAALPADAPSLRYGPDPGQARAFAREQALRAGLPPSKVADVVIAVGELAANTLRHTAGDGIVTVWTSPAELLCEVRDSGQITDALAGRRCPAPDAAGGHGLRVVQQVCDLVEMRTGPSGTTFRLHFRRVA
jgi:anti-sigma regulatory factor (Ser/Thr protein kinase)